MSTRTAYRIKDWATHFETTESRKRRGALAWVSLPTQHDGKRFRRLSTHARAAEIFAAWCLILEVAAKCPKRGTLIDDHGHALDAQDLADMTGFPHEIFDLAFAELTTGRIGWIETVSLPESAGACGNLPEPAGISADVPESAGACGKSSPTGQDSTGPKPNPTKQNRTKPNTNTGAPKSEAQGEPGAASDFSSSGSSDSGSAPPTRERARVTWRVRCSKLWARAGTSQRHGDDTSTDGLFDDYVWPESIDDDVGAARYAQAFALIPQASGRAKPMAWLTTRIHQQFPLAMSNL